MDKDVKKILDTISEMEELHQSTDIGGVSMIYDQPNPEGKEQTVRDTFTLEDIKNMPVPDTNREGV